MKEENEIYELYERCTTENTIMCSNCKTIGRQMDVDPYQAAGEWKAIGWRATRNNIYCRKCAEVKLKT